MSSAKTNVEPARGRSVLPILKSYSSLKGTMTANIPDDPFPLQSGLQQSNIPAP